LKPQKSRSRQTGTGFIDHFLTSGKAEADWVACRPFGHLHFGCSHLDFA